LRIAVAATPEVAIDSLNALRNSEFELALVITQPDRPAGRGQELRQSAVSAWAASAGIDCQKPATKDEFLKLASSVDLMITIGYGKILTLEELSAPTYGSINLHFSLLPKWRGAAPVQRSIEAGDSVTGVTVFKLDEGMDTGPIYLMKRFALDDDITSDELFKELSELGSEALLESLKMIEDGAKPTPQSSTDVTKAAKITKTECQINWNEDALKISRRIRAFTTHPGAWTIFRGSTVKIDSPIIEEKVLKPGEILFEDKKLFVGTSTAALSLGFITPQGKTRTAVQSWVNGARLLPGELFG
jgi:methionyl-tRNA formyltransferase